MEQLRAENTRLRHLLAEHSIPIPDFAKEKPPPTQTPKPVGEVSTLDRAARRIALYRSLFRGREDVYAVRWENPDGRSGYAPKADRDWKAYLSAEDSDRKKVDRQTRTFRPLTDAVVRGHLLGEHTIGIYPLLLDETCWFLAVDFDKKTWRHDAVAFLEDMPGIGSTRCAGALALWRGWAHLDIFRPSDPSDHSEETRLLDPHPDHGA